MTYQLSSAALRLLGTRGDLLELAAIDTTILKNGAAVYVTDQNAVFALLKESAVAPDGLNIVAPLQSSGRWFRQTVASLVNNDSLVPGATVKEALNNLLGSGSGSSVWGQVTDWYWDPADATGNASDSNVGDNPSAPLLTGLALSSRLNLSPITVAPDVHVMSSVPVVVPPTDYLNLTPLYLGPAAGTISIIGEANEDLSGTLTLTGVVNENPGTGARASITVAGIDWTTAGPGGSSLIGFRVRRISDNATAWLQLLGGAADTAFINRPLNAAETSNVNFAIGDDVVVESLTRVGPVSCAPRSYDFSQYPITFDSCHVGGAGQFMAVDLTNMARCHVEAAWLEHARTSQMSGSRLQINTYYGGTNCTWNACWLQVTVLSASLRHVMTRNCSSTAPAGLIVGGSSVISLSTSGALGCWDWGGTNRGGVTLGTSARMSVSSNLLWGTTASANTLGIGIEAGGLLRYTTQPTITGSLVNDFSVGGVQDVYANLPAAGQDPGSNDAWFVQ